MPKELVNLVSNSTGFPTQTVHQVMEMLEGGATIPFMARYRKERTGSLDEVEIGKIVRETKRLSDLQKRKEFVLHTISEQGKLTDELKKQIENTWDSVLIEDLYLPFKPKRKTRASLARDRGLESLAEKIYRQGDFQPKKLAQSFLNEEVTTVEDALQGARDIVAEWISESAGVRQKCRNYFKRTGWISSKVVQKKAEEGSKYKDYFEFSEKLNRSPSHRILALFRGENEGFLRVQIRPDEDRLLPELKKMIVKNNSPSAKEVNTAMEDSYKRLIRPSLESEFRKGAKERADEEAIAIFAKNLQQLLMAPPLGAINTLAIDPGFRTGCKTVCLNSSGDLLWHGTIFPHLPQKQTEESGRQLIRLIKKYDIQAIAVGNGTAGRETVEFCRGIPEVENLEVYMVSESGASIYSASEVAREEFPDLDLTVRGAVSIGRRLMDPLAELVKLEPRHVGVGQYQHDVDQNLLKSRLEEVVEWCVNSVGVNLLTASKHLLAYVAGLGPALAESIVRFRSEGNKLNRRKDLLKVPKLGPVAFQQSAGFLRLPDSLNLLDNTGVHPERYALVEKMAADLGVGLKELINSAAVRKNIDPQKYLDKEVGMPTILDILKELEKPGHDPRGKAKIVEFSAIGQIEDVQPGMEVTGVVTNLAKFGAFVDIGIKQNGMIHISQICDRFIKDPAEELSLGQQVRAKVLNVDLERGRISLSLKKVRI